jgi:hypothetical protein
MEERRGKVGKRTDVPLQMAASCTDSAARMKVVFGKIEVQNFKQILGLN